MLYGFFNGNKEKLNDTKEAVYIYLLNERGYEKSDIVSIKPEYSWLDEERNAYIAFVTFKDEPDIKYEYSYNEKDGVRAFGGDDPNGKHNQDKE